jgi:type IV secretion system protein VirB6
MTIISDLFRDTNAVFGTFFLGTASDIAGAARPVFNVMVSLYVVLWGLAVWRGMVQEPLSDGVARILKIVLIGTIALTAGVYGPQIASPLFRLPDNIALIILPTATSAGGTLDTALARGMDVAGIFFSATSLFAPIDALILGFQAILVFLATIALVGYAAALILMAKIALTIVLSIGPLFIIGLLFEPTKNFFSGWLGQAINAVMHYVVAAVIVALGIAFFQAQATATVTAMSGVSNPSVKDLAALAIVSVAIFVALMQSGQIASALAGGISLSTMGAVGWAMGKIGSGASAPLRIPAWNRQRIANDYHRQQMGLGTSLSTKALSTAGAPVRWAMQRLRGQNTVEKN